MDPRFPAEGVRKGKLRVCVLLGEEARFSKLGRGKGETGDKTAVVGGRAGDPKTGEIGHVPA